MNGMKTNGSDAVIHDCTSICRAVFEETTNTALPGEKRVLYEIKEILYQGHSKYQDILVFESQSCGRVLVINGVIQLTEFDEFSYHETLAFISLACHQNPKKVLIVGGGDGGMAREVAKFPSVESVTVCDIDEDVVDVSKKFFPTLAKSFQSPKVNLVIKDALEFLRSNNSNEKYDVIISDACDPDEEGPQMSLSNEEFIQLLRKSMTADGVLCMQTGNNMWQHHPVAMKIVSYCRNIFPVVCWSYAQVPTFSLSQNGFVICGLNKNLDPSCPKWEFTESDLDAMNMKYYNTPFHKGAFALPRFADIFNKNSTLQVNENYALNGNDRDNP